jgi:hypothetical protein
LSTPNNGFEKTLCPLVLGRYFHQDKGRRLLVFQLCALNGALLGPRVEELTAVLTTVFWTVLPRGPLLAVRTLFGSK